MKKLLVVVFLFFSAWTNAQTWLELNQKGLDLYKAGDYKTAISQYEEALKKAEADFGLASSEYTSSLSNLGYAQSYDGDFFGALNTFQKASKIYSRIHPLPHLDQLQVLVELSKVHINLAQYDSADWYIRYAKYMYEVQIPQQNEVHADTAGYWITDAGLKMYATEASIMHKKGQLDRSISLLKEIDSFIKQAYPIDYQQLSDYRINLSNLATYSNEAGEIEASLQFAMEYDRLIQEDGSILDQIYSAQNLGAVYRNFEIYDSAIYFWDRALQQINNSNFEGSHIHNVILNNLGELYVQLEEYDRCLSALNQSIDLQESNLSVHPPLYKTTLLNLAACHHWKGEYAIADSLYTLLTELWLDDVQFNFTYLSENEKMSFYRNQVSVFQDFAAFGLEISGLLPLQESDEPYIDPNISSRLFNLQLNTKAIILNSSQRMRNQILNSDDETLSELYLLWEEKKFYVAQALVDDQRSDAELLVLQKQVDEIERQLIQRSGNFKKGFLSERVNWKDIQRTLKPGEAAVEMIRFFDGLIYGALILTPDTKDRPVFSLVMSKKGKHLDHQYFTGYYNSTIYKLKDTVSYAAYWQPIFDSIVVNMPKQKTPDRIFFSNAGIYNRINLNTLNDPETGKYVLDETEIIYLTNTRDLLVDPSERQMKKKIRDAFLFGDPLFNLDKEESGENTRGAVYSDLPGTGIEVDLINSSLQSRGWNTMVFKGEMAHEKNLLELEKADVLHIATHGYFNPGSGKETMSLAETMIRSGIVMAGVNDPVNENGDGIVTAYELANLNLEETELVVLSACETGKGISQSEGVYGLQRAMMVAGTKHLIMSLWKVDDQATQKLMTSFYKFWLNGIPMRAAFSQAQMEIRQQYPDPYYWGAFVLAGN